MYESLLMAKRIHLYYFQYKDKTWKIQLLDRSSAYFWVPSGSKLVHSCIAGFSYYSAPQLYPSQWARLKHYPIFLCWLFLQLILIKCQPQPLVYPTPVFIFSRRLNDNKPLSLLSKQENCHSEVQGTSQPKAEIESKNMLSLLKTCSDSSFHQSYWTNEFGLGL